MVLYHVHSLDPERFGGFKGGFFGVELFFVVSGYLISSLLLQEVDETGRVDLAQFWMRRARRLLPALVVMIVAVGIAAVIWRGDTLGQIRRDLPWAIFYASNWGQIFDESSGYFAALSTPPLLRHLWSLAVEEQWYLIWPLVFGVLARRRVGQLALPLAIAGLAAAVLGAVLYDGSEERANLVYLSTLTRSSGLLLGSALAVFWRPWRSARAGQRPLPVLDVLAFVGLVVFGFAVSQWSNADSIVYRGGMLVVSLMSVVLIAVSVHPGARLTQAVLSHPVLVAIGQRSYGLYLWHWPLLVLTDAVASTVRLLVVGVLIVAVTEASYRFVEQPLRAGALGLWWKDRSRPSFERIGYGIAAAALVLPLASVIARAESTDLIVGGETQVFDLNTVTTLTPGGAPAAVAGAGDASAVVPTTVAVGPLSVVVVGDSQAHSLVANKPAGIEQVFAITDGSVDGCGVWDDGTLWSRLDGYKRANRGCAGWEKKWAASAAAAKAKVALVVIGAWDVFDVAYVEGVTGFASPKWDERFTASVQKGIAALREAGARVALLEVPCFNPVAAKGSSVPPLPERGEPWRTNHVNGLLKAVAGADPANVTFVEGPDAWCADPAISTDLAYRWDGVHVFKPGAKLVFDSVAPALIAIAPPAAP